MYASGGIFFCKKVLKIMSQPLRWIVSIRVGNGVNKRSAVWCVPILLSSSEKSPFDGTSPLGPVGVPFFHGHRRKGRPVNVHKYECIPFLL